MNFFIFSSGSSGFIIGLCVAGVVLTLFVGLILLLIQRSRNQSSLERHTTLLVKRMPDKPLTLKKPTPAVKSTGQTVAGGVVLKKSPSPTGSKSPPGSASNYTSPVDHEKCLPSLGKRRKDSSDSALSHNSHASTKVTPESEQVTSDSLFYKIFSTGDSRNKDNENKASTVSTVTVKNGETNSSNQRYKVSALCVCVCECFKETRDRHFCQLRSHINTHHDAAVMMIKMFLVSHSLPV